MGGRRYVNGAVILGILLLLILISQFELLFIVTILSG